MFKFICLFALISAAFAASIGNVESTTEKRVVVPLLNFERQNNPDGSFSFTYEGGDQSFRQETAHVVDAGTEDEALEVSGSYRYIDEEGQTVEVHYTAGKNGFVPVGTNILSEISAAAKAAADLPQNSEEELKRKGRSNAVEEIEEHKVEEHQVEEQKVEESKVEETKVEEAKVEEAKVEEAKVEETKVEETKVEEPKVEAVEVAATEVHEEPKPVTA
ncbi:larval cuticle protein LCP-17-like [Calliphora vicina]|uniref:larval cuticle protein LCP-17-like n=1 Tax=Calliphora vicina TaxID=7373 RepID=UPI00325AC708